MLGVAHSRVQARARFPRLIFEGETFPAAELERPSRLEEKFGSCEVLVRYFDRQGREVTRAETPGPYAAFVEIRPAGQSPSHRFFTLYRLAQPVADDWIFRPEDPADLAVKLGVEPAVIERQKDLIAARFAGRRFDDLARLPLTARFVGGSPSRRPRPSRSASGTTPRRSSASGGSIGSRPTSRPDRSEPSPSSAPTSSPGHPRPSSAKGPWKRPG